MNIIATILAALALIAFIAFQGLALFLLYVVFYASMRDMRTDLKAPQSLFDFSKGEVGVYTIDDDGNLIPVPAED